MNRIAKTRIVPLVLFLLLALSVALHARTLRRLTAYQRKQPQSSPFEAGKCKSTGLVAHWRFDDSAGSMVRDDGPVGNHAQVRVAPSSWPWQSSARPKLVAGKTGKAFEFDQKQWVSASNNDCFTSEQITVVAWVWQEDEDATVPTIAAKSTWPHDGWWLCSTSNSIQGRDRYIEFGIAWGSDFAHVESGYQLPLREWHHIAASLDNVRHEAQFFIDGKRFGETHTNVPSWGINWDHDLFVGEYDGSGRWAWRGKLDDVRIYNRTLAPDEALELYATTSGAML